VLAAAAEEHTPVRPLVPSDARDDGGRRGPPPTGDNGPEERTMSEHPHVTLLRGAYEAFGKGDIAALDDVFAEDIRWHEPGRNQLSGTYEGRTAVYEMFGRLMEITEGSFRMEVRTVLADDDHAVSVVDSSARRGENSFSVMNTHVSRFAGDRVAEFWETTDDQYAVDAVFG
jgi:ketosteroid isomerase-like protein